MAESCFGFSCWNLKAGRFIHASSLDYMTTIIIINLNKSEIDQLKGFACLPIRSDPLQGEDKPVSPFGATLFRSSWSQRLGVSTLKIQLFYRDNS